MRFLTTNFCTETATTVTASSQNPNFSATNLKNPLRSKRWRSSGTFVIDSTNNKIDFKETSGGALLTATLTSGSYSSLNLALEIKTRMQAVGASLYTVTYSKTTGLWTILSSGAYFSLLNNTGTNQLVSVFKKCLGYLNVDKTGALTYTGTNIAIHTKERITFDFKTIENLNSLVLLWPKEDGVKLSDTAIVKVEASATNTWTSPGLSQVVTLNYDYEVGSVFFTTDQAYRYWSITIEDSANPNLYVELGTVWIGQDNGFQEPENGFKFVLSDGSNLSVTEFGHVYVDEYPQIATLDFSYAYIKYVTAKALENSYRKNGTRKPVLVVFDNLELVFTKDHFLIYGLFEKSFTLNHVTGDLFNGTVKITELG